MHSGTLEGGLDRALQDGHGSYVPQLEATGLGFALPRQCQCPSHISHLTFPNHTFFLRWILGLALGAFHPSLSSSTLAWWRREAATRRSMVSLPHNKSHALVGCRVWMALMCCRARRLLATL